MKRFRIDLFLFSKRQTTSRESLFSRLFTPGWMVLFAFLLILGCRTKVYNPEDPIKLPYKVKGAEDREVFRLQKSLTRCGVAVITIGQDYLISIPSLSLFPNQSPQLTWPSYGLLNQVVRFLQQFRKVAITITGYTGKSISEKREHALTLARTRAVADYLWSQGIDSRFVFTEGAGADKPIMRPSGGGDKTGNSRIEITFRDAIV